MEKYALIRVLANRTGRRGTLTAPNGIDPFVFRFACVTGGVLEIDRLSPAGCVRRA
jgi:hypothetical protein